MATNPEQLLISAILREGAFLQASEQGINVRHFSSKVAEWEFLEEHWKKYKKTPSRMVFRQHFPDFVIRPVNDVLYAADEVKRALARRMLVASMKDTADFITDGQIDTAIDRMREAILSVASETMPGFEGDIFQKNDDVLKKVKMRKDRYEELGSSGIPTGIPLIDEYTGGMGPNEHWVLAARQGQGKSWLLQYIAASASMAGYNTYFAALEQTRAQVSMRIFSMLAAHMKLGSFRSENLMRGRGYDDAEFREFVRTIRSEQKKRGFGQLIVADQINGKITPLSLTAQIERYNPDVVFIDYIQLMNSNRMGGPAALAQIVEEITAITNQRQIPIVSASQLNRESTQNPGKDAGTENLSGTDQLGNDATVVLTLKQLSPTVSHLRNVKNRYGIGGWGSYMKFLPDEGVCATIDEETANDLIDEDRLSQKLRNKNAPINGRIAGLSPDPDVRKARRLKKLKASNTITAKAR